MAFGLIRARNLSSADINSTDKHNARRYEKKEQYPDNVLFDKRTDHNISVQYLTNKSDNYLHKSDTNLTNVINDRLAFNEVKGIKSNSNLAIEYVVGINDKKAWDNYDFDGFIHNTTTWIEKKHGLNSVVAIYSHLDESNPHAHIVVVPIEKKIVKWKNTKGFGEREENRLNTRNYTGGRDKLRGLQNDWFNHLTERYNGGAKLGLKLFRGTLVENQLKEYVRQTNHEIAELRTVLANLTNEIDKNTLSHHILEKEHFLTLNQTKLKEEEDRRQNQKKDIWKLKGTKDNSNIFHTDDKKRKSGMRR